MDFRFQVLVCAHRYISRTGESQHGQGLCYVLSNDLKYDETYEPCKGRTTTRAHEDYGFCQVGTSGTILDDNTIVLGTPGPYTWRGTVFVISVGGEYLKRDKIHYYGPHLEQTSPVDKYSYLGMWASLLCDRMTPLIYPFPFFCNRNGGNRWQILR